MVLLQLDLPAVEARREFPQPSGRVRRINRLEQREAVGPDLVCQRLSLRLSFRQAARIEARARALGRAGVEVQP